MSTVRIISRALVFGVVFASVGLFMFAATIDSDNFGHEQGPPIAQTGVSTLKGRRWFRTPAPDTKPKGGGGAHLWTALLRGSRSTPLLADVGRRAACYLLSGIRPRSLYISCSQHPRTGTTLAMATTSAAASA